MELLLIKGIITRVFCPEESKGNSYRDSKVDRSTLTHLYAGEKTSLLKNSEEQVERRSARESVQK